MNINYLVVGLTASVLLIGGCSSEPESGSAEETKGTGILEKTLDSVKEGVQTTADQIGESANEAGTAISETATQSETMMSTASD